MRVGLLAFLAALGASSALSAPLPQEAIEAYLGPQQRVEIAPDRSLNLVCMGSGDRTVLFDAGGSDWSVVWALVQPVIAGKARACAYDRAGLGESDAAPGPRSPFAIVEDLHALIAAAALDPPLILVGHSLGGFNVKLYAALYPDDVAGLVLLDPAEDRWWDRTRSWATETYGPRTAARSELLDQRFIGTLIERYRTCADTSRAADLDPTSLAYRRCTDPVRPQLGAAIADTRRRLQTRPAYQQAQSSEVAFSVYGDDRSDPVYAELFRPNVFGALPLVVLTHDEPPTSDPLDQFATEQSLRLHRETAHLSERGRHRVITGSGHYIQLDQPAEVVAAIDEILSALQP